MMQRTWFNTKDFSSLEIIQFQSISKHNVIKSIVINDTTIIQSLVAAIERIDPNGDMMVSWGPDAEHMELILKNETGQEVVEVYQRKFKTPSTGFHGSNELEKSLYQEIEKLLSDFRSL